MPGSPEPNPVLGEARLALRGGRLIFEAGTARSELQLIRDETGGVETFIFADPPLAGPLSVALRRSVDGRPQMVLTARGETPSTSYTDDDPGITPEMTYVYTRVGPGAAATPPQ